MHASPLTTIRRSLGGALLLGSLAWPLAAAAQTTPDLWGVDEDDGQLFRIRSYDGAGGPAIFDDFGPLQWNDGGLLTEIGDDIEAVTLSPDGTLFMAIDDDIGGFTLPVLLAFDIDAASMVTPNVVDLRGEIGIGFDSSGDNLSGLSIDPLTGAMWALLKDSSETDELWVLPDPNNAPGLATRLGDLSGAGGTVLRGEDLEFDESGRLYVVDDRSGESALENVLWEIVLDRDTDDTILGISDVVSVLTTTGLTGPDGKLEAIGWDFENDVLIGSDDDNDRFARLVGGAGPADLGSLGSFGLTDVEGIDFVPLGEAPPPIPEPGTALLLGLGLAGLATRRRADRSRVTR